MFMFHCLLYGLILIHKRFHIDLIFSGVELVESDVGHGIPTVSSLLTHVRDVLQAVSKLPKNTTIMYKVPKYIKIKYKLPKNSKIKYKLPKNNTVQ
jgi:hypothetical protein